MISGCRCPFDDIQKARKGSTAITNIRIKQMFNACLIKFSLSSVCRIQHHQAYLRIRKKSDRKMCLLLFRFSLKILFLSNFLVLYRRKNHVTVFINLDSSWDMSASLVPPLVVDERFSLFFFRWKLQKTLFVEPIKMVINFQISSLHLALENELQKWRPD